MGGTMKTKFLLLILLWLSVAISAVGQVKKEEPEKVENIRCLLKMVGVERIQQGMMDQMLAALKNAIPPTSNQSGQKMLDRLTEILGEEFKKIGFTNMAIELYDKYFTAEEIKGLIQFYESPVGQKAIQVLPGLTQESTTRGIELGKTAGMKAMERWLDEFPELKNLAAPRD